MFESDFSFQLSLEARAEKSTGAFREQKLVILPFLNFFIQTVNIPPIVGYYELSVVELWSISILC